jgi:hypothetical protein
MNARPLIGALALSLLATPVNAEQPNKHKKAHAHARALAPSIETPEAKYPKTDPYAVWVGGTYVGRDPDPNVRAAMIREFNHNLDNN